jgi:hypothetical protein
MKLIPHMELKVPMCGKSFESTLFLASYDVDVIRPELCCVECIMDLKAASVLTCMLNNVLDMGHNVLFNITICTCVLFVWTLCVSWLDSTWTL